MFSEIFTRYISFSVTDKGSNLLSLLIPLIEIMVVIPLNFEQFMLSLIKNMYPPLLLFVGFSVSDT